MVVQLAVLAALMRMTIHYLVATTLAIEATLIHNFAWHLRFTWRDRRSETGLVGRLVRFHLSNGLVSMAGNLALMPWLVGVVGMPVLIANGVAILCCSIVNFCLGDAWVFGASKVHAAGKAGHILPSLRPD
jgi:putative flippase GtrA